MTKFILAVLRIFNIINGDQPEMMLIQTPSGHEYRQITRNDDGSINYI